MQSLPGRPHRAGEHRRFRLAGKSRGPWRVSGSETICKNCRVYCKNMVPIVKFRGLCILLAWLILLSPPWSLVARAAWADGTVLAAAYDDDEEEDEDDDSGGGGQPRIDELRGWLNKRQQERGVEVPEPAPARNYGVEPDYGYAPAHRHASRHYSRPHRAVRHRSRRSGHHARRHYSGHHKQYRGRHYHSRRGVRTRKVYGRSSRRHSQHATAAHGKRRYGSVHHARSTARHDARRPRLHGTPTRARRAASRQSSSHKSATARKTGKAMHTTKAAKVSNPGTHARSRAKRSH